MKKIELLAPAGDLEKLIIAVDYGADAVYFGGDSFSLRAGAGNLSVEDMQTGVEYAHSKSVKCYLTVNIYAHNEDIEPLEAYLNRIKHIPIDAVLISDPGVIAIVKKVMPDMELHLSTQANMTNYMTARFWYEQGIRRIVLARELTLGEIRCISEKKPENMELEAFVHGAMCISYSGRCLLSNYMIDRDANRGQCAHPCRWKYKLVEEKRPGEYYPVEEDARGTYILNSKDLCMLEHIPEIIEAGVTSLKIEGRMKSIFYAATVIDAYRRAIDSYCAAPESYEYDSTLMREMTKASHREFTTGFYFSRPQEEGQNYLTSEYTREYSFTGLVQSYDEETGFAVVEQRNKMVLGDEIEVFSPGRGFFKQTLTEMYDQDGESIDSAPHPQQILKIKMSEKVYHNDMLRKLKV